MTERSIYQFTARKPDGELRHLIDYHDKVLLIVNIASECGFTPQLRDLESLRKDFDGEDFRILAFPSNDFGGQEPLEGEAISSFCKFNFDTHFEIFDKIRVRGSYAHPLFQFLRDKNKNGYSGSSPKWNFHKYLIDRDGRVVDFFYPFTKPGSSRIKKRIVKLLNNKIL